MNNEIVHKQQIPFVISDNEWIETVLTSFNKSGGKNSVHVLEVSTNERLQLLKQKGWYAPRIFNKKPSKTKVLVSTDIKESNLKMGWSVTKLNI